MSNVYDLVHYPGAPYERTHPTTLGLYAALAGLPFAPFETCRVLEIGCGDGVNLIAMAMAAPRARFVGVDLAEVPILRARADAAACRLGNTEFHARDLGEIDASFGSFHYIIAHGVLAWVPDFVRAALFRVIGERLAPGGLAMVSYNALPGSRLRQTLRDMMLYETREAATPEEKVRRSVAFLERFSALWSHKQAEERLMADEARRILERNPATLFHDEMAEIFAPQLFSDVVQMAAANGLAYLADARPRQNLPALMPDEDHKALRELVAGDAVRFEQQVDFLSVRRFRSSIFVKGARADLQREPARLKGLWARGELRVAEAKPSEPDKATFEIGAKLRITTNDSALTTLLTRVGDVFPHSLSLDETAATPALAEQVFRVYLSEILRLTTAPLGASVEVGVKPVANALARVQAERGEANLVTLLHGLLRIEDPTVLKLITLLDGTRNRAQLAEEWSAAVGVGLEETRAALEPLLSHLARAGLMAG